MSIKHTFSVSALAICMIGSAQNLAAKTSKLSCEDQQRVRQAASEAYKSLHPGDGQYAVKDIRVTERNGTIRILYPNTDYSRIFKAYAESSLVGSQQDNADGYRPSLLHKGWLLLEYPARIFRHSNVTDSCDAN